MIIAFIFYKNQLKKLRFYSNKLSRSTSHPILATGGSAISSLETLKKNNASDITLVCLLASEEGIRNVKEKFSDVKIICAQKDDKLNEKGFIVPGLGDAGDRIFDT